MCGSSFADVSTEISTAILRTKEYEEQAKDFVENFCQS
jgi:hypothetical protein